MKKKKFNMPTAYTILLIIIAVVAILTWIIPAGEWVDGVYNQVDPNPQGLYNIISAPIAGFFDAIDIALFIMVIGGFLGIVIKTGAMDAGISKVLKKNKGKEHVLIPILMILFGIGGTTYGMAEETIAFYPLIIPVFVAAGYDVVVAVMVVLLGAGVGVLGSTINPFAIGAASDSIGISLGNGLGHRLILLVLVEAAAIFFTMRYAKKVKENKNNSIVSDLMDEHKNHFLGRQAEQAPELTGRRKVILILFALTFVIMILGVIPWAYKFDINIFNNVYNSLAQFKILGMEPNTAETYSAHYDSIKTHSAPLGDWWFGQMTVLFFIMSIVIGLVARMKEKEIVETFIAGTKDLLGVALIVGVSRGIKIVMSAGGMDATILYWGAESLKAYGELAFINLTYIFYLPLSFLVPSTSGLAGASIPIMGPLGDIIYNSMQNHTGAAYVITAFSSASGVLNLITPTSGVVMGALAIARIPYERWLKHVLKFLLVLSVIIMVLLSVVTLIF